jgi:hypothetical protein
MSNPEIDRCAAHLAQDHYEQWLRVRQRGQVAGHDKPEPEWAQLTAEERLLNVRTMYSMLYRGAILCPRPEHRIGISLR